MADTNDVLQEVRDRILVRLKAVAVAWVNDASFLEVTEFGVPPLGAEESIQYILHTEVWGQDGGLQMNNVVVEIASVTRLSQDNIGRIDALMREGRDKLCEVQRALEGHSLDYLEIPLYTDMGPTRPEVYEVEPAFGFCYLVMSGTKGQELARWIGIGEGTQRDAGYVTGYN